MKPPYGMRYPLEEDFRRGLQRRVKAWPWLEGMLIGLGLGLGYTAVRSAGEARVAFQLVAALTALLWLYARFVVLPDYERWLAEDEQWRNDWPGRC